MSTSSLQPFGPEIWLADGSETEVIGFRYPTRMAVIRLAGGGLFIWSPVALTKSLQQQLQDLGEIRHLVAPNSLHHLFLEQWRQAYPLAKLYAAPGLDVRRKDLAFYAELGDAPPSEWSADLDQVLMRGNGITTEVVFFHRPSGTALFTDLLQQFPPGWFRGWRAIVARLDLMTAPNPRCPGSSAPLSSIAAPPARRWRAFSNGRPARSSWPTAPRCNGTAKPSSPERSGG